MNSYRDLDAYKVSKELAGLIYQQTAGWPKEETFGLTQQIRRAAVSVASNLAEGVGRATSKDTLQFLAIARGSCFEVETQSDLACDFGYLSPDQLKQVFELSERCKMLLNGLINRYKSL